MSLALKCLEDGLNLFWEPVLLHLIVGTKRLFLMMPHPHIINFYKGIQDGKITAPLIKQYLEKEGNNLCNAGNEGYDLL
jgi:hypothetical protein